MDDIDKILNIYIEIATSSVGKMIFGFFPTNKIICDLINAGYIYSMELNKDYFNEEELNNFNIIKQDYFLCH